jgi:hypothetical protein
LVSSIGKLKKNKVISVNTAGGGKKNSRTSGIQTLRRALSDVESRARSNAERRVRRARATPLPHRRRARGGPALSRKTRDIEKEIRKGTADARSAEKVARGAPRRAHHRLI